MAAKRRPREKDLYLVVETWLKKHRRCFKTAINKGLQHSRIDVVGIRDIGGDLSGEIETISVEVKRGTEAFATASGQAFGYKVYANRVYLADLRDEPFSDDEVQIAGHLGIGLIRIKGRRCREELSSPFYAPITRMHLALLEKLKLGYCQLCGTVFETRDAKSSQKRTSRHDLGKAAAAKTGLIFWNWDLGVRKSKLGIRNGAADSYERRYLCPSCVTTIAGPWE